MESNEGAAFPDPVGEAAKLLLGVDYLFPYQRLVVANTLEAAGAAGLELAWPQGIRSDEIREDASPLGRQIVILPTGAGKSLCFQLPALLLRRPTLIIFPILALMTDQERRLTEQGFAPAVLRGGQDAAERDRSWKRIAEGDARVAIANPEVLLTESSLRRLGDACFAHLVADEAHCVSEWGESFRPSYLRIGEIIEASRAPLVTAFTATASPIVLEKIERYVFGDAGARKIVGNPDRQNIAYSAVGTLLRDRTVSDLVGREPRPSIVFCATRARTERLARQLRAELPETETRFYHAGLSRAEKREVERWFFESGDAVLIATTAYGMGVDKANIRTVVHRDCPPTAEAYLQESGRAGRDGASSRAILLWGPEDMAALARMSGDSARSRFAALVSYARDSTRCRREALLELMGAACECCAGCDVCEGNASPFVREREAILSFVARNKRRYDADEAAEIIAARSSNRWTGDEASTALKRLMNDGTIEARKLPPWRGKLVPGHSSSSVTSTSAASAFAFFFGAAARRAAKEGREGRLSRAT